MGRGNGALALAAVAAMGIGVQISAEGFSLPPIGYFWQGRYALPLLVGVPIIASSLVSHRSEGRRRRSAARLERFVGPRRRRGSGVAQLASFLQAVRRFAVTLDGPANPVTYLSPTPMEPVDGAGACLGRASFAAGLAATGWVALRRPSDDAALAELRRGRRRRPAPP